MTPLYDLASRCMILLLVTWTVVTVLFIVAVFIVPGVREAWLVHRLHRDMDRWQRDQRRAWR